MAPHPISGPRGKEKREAHGGHEWGEVPGRHWWGQGECPQVQEGLATTLLCPGHEERQPWPGCVCTGLAQVPDLAQTRGRWTPAERRRA
jgi:hypothetical protein